MLLASARGRLDKQCVPHDRSNTSSSTQILTILPQNAPLLRRNNRKSSELFPYGPVMCHYQRLASQMCLFHLFYRNACHWRVMILRAGTRRHFTASCVKKKNSVILRQISLNCVRAKRAEKQLHGKQKQVL